MIDPAAIERDARACIADWPVTIRHYPDGNNLSMFSQVTASIGSNDYDVLLQPGGLLSNFSATILAIVNDFMQGGAGVLPKVYDRVDVQIRGNWLETTVTRMPDILDPLLPHIQIMVGSPDA